MTRFLVTGCGRSGTGYVANLLTALGLPTGHEAIFNPVNLRGDEVVWPEELPGESSWLGAPFLGCLPPETVVLHQVREPVAVVRSFLRIRFFETPSPYLDFAVEHFPELESGPPEERALRYWIGWNQLVELATELGAGAYHRYRLEDVDAPLVEEILRALDQPLDSDRVREVVEKSPRDYNSRGAKATDTITWSDLERLPLAAEARELAARYGYAGETESGTLAVGPVPA